MSSSGPRKRCAFCGHFPLEPLAKFDISRVKTGPTVDSYTPTNRTWGLLAPEAVLTRILVSWAGVLFWDAWKVRRKRAKIARAQREILPRNPDALVCGACGETLEIIE